MKCPACAEDLRELKVAGLAVDVCDGPCGGIWFAHFEINKVDEAHAALTAALLALPFNPQAVVVPNRRACPRCVEVVMMQHKFRPDKPVVVDECPNCGGLWLDGGELAEIRRDAPTAEDRKKAGQQFLSQLFNQELAQLKARRAAPPGN